MANSLSETGDSNATLVAHAFRHYAKDLHRFLRRRLWDPQKVDDVAQEVFSRLARVRQEEVIEKPHSYLFGIAFHVIREMWLREKQDVLDYDSSAMEEAAEHPHVLDRDDLPNRLNAQKQLEHALMELPEVHRTLVLMCKRDGMTYEEASAATGISIHMVEKYLIQARAKLLNMMWDL